MGDLGGAEGRGDVQASPGASSLVAAQGSGRSFLGGSSSLGWQLTILLLG